MRVVLDSGALTRFARSGPRQAAADDRGDVRYLVSTSVMIESLTGDPRRDHAEDRFLRLCKIEPITDDIARLAARLRTLAGGSARPSVVDASVVALAVITRADLVLTGDVEDLVALAAVAPQPVRVESI
jgi:predicted nucleic acid-binding protein